MLQCSMTLRRSVKLPADPQPTREPSTHVNVAGRFRRENRMARTPATPAEAGFAWPSPADAFRTLFDAAQLALQPSGALPLGEGEPLTAEAMRSSAGVPDGARAWRLRAPGVAVAPAQAPVVFVEGATPAVAAPAHAQWIGWQQAAARAGHAVAAVVVPRSAAALAAEQASQRDPLTGLLNRRGLEAGIQALLAAVTSPVAVALIDIDHFKVVNDQHGHLVGDQVLCDIAALLARAVRQGDCLGRWGGEEFLALLPDTDAAGAAIVAERLRHAVETDAFYDLPRFPSDGAGTAESIRLQVTISVGVATAVRPAAPRADGVVRRADAALLAAKSGGKNRVVLAPSGEEPAG